MAVGPSQTAIGAAVGRAIHLMDAGPRVFEDVLAMDLAGEPGQAQLKTLQELPPEFEPDELEQHLHLFGFRRVDHFSAQDARRVYLQDRPDVRLTDIERPVTATI